VRAVIQRVSHASVTVAGERLAEIGQGLVVLLGVAAGDTTEDAYKLARKTAELRIFSDADGRFNLSLLDVGGEALVVSQFTRLADTPGGGVCGGSAGDRRRGGDGPLWGPNAGGDSQSGAGDHPSRQRGVRASTKRLDGHFSPGIYWP
jgi:hypothetical protein